jgi:polyisoprenoid-binding protein YceI
MKKYLLGIIFLSVTIAKSYGQLYMTRTGFIGFYSKTSMEDIQAENNQAYAVIDLTKQNIAFAVLLKGFTFPKELMQEHFNENYMETDKYPKATFTGSFTGNVVPGKDGVYPISVKGSLTMHGVSKNIEMPGTLQVKGGQVLASASFAVVPEDYNVSIPSLVREKIQKTLKVNIQATCDKH